MADLKFRIVIAGCALCMAGVVFARREEPASLIAPEPVPVDSRVGADGCPDGEADGGLGPDMVRLPDGFCIDVTEVSRGQYDAWWATSPNTGGQSAECAGNDDFEPACLWPPKSNENELPVVCVDWCDARAFCEAAGKRLCGQVGEGTSYPPEQYDDSQVSEWQAACSSGGKYAYTYGDESNTDSCRDGDAEDYTTWGLVDVGTQPDCRSPDAEYSAVYDLTGNVAEWDNSCDGDDPEAGCRIRGGSFEHQGEGLRCAMAKNLSWPRMRTVVSVGFRCCAD